MPYYRRVTLAVTEVNLRRMNHHVTSHHHIIALSFQHMTTSPRHHATTTSRHHFGRESGVAKGCTSRRTARWSEESMRLSEFNAH